MKVVSIAFLLSTILLLSCHSSQEIIRYEYSQAQKATAHWESERFVTVELKDKNDFTIQIIENSFYGNSPFTDTISINGQYIKGRKGYLLQDLSDEQVRFKLRRNKNEIWFKGTYYDKRNSAYITIKNQSKF